MVPTMLVVDDQEEMAELVCDVAGMVGFKAEAVTSVRDLFKKFEVAMPDVIVLDLIMPDIDGLELIQKLSRTGSRSKLIIMSGYQSSYLRAAEILADGLGLTTIGVIRKPASISDLELQCETAKRAVELDRSARHV
ncbi:response regulator [Thalassobaculum sp.]|uniref:response regulator n=1 Tax=Thalassobaculum sp. TaxID=2022740 RepID=UPI0032EB033D